MNFYQENIKEWTQYYNDPDRLRAFSKIEEWYSLWDDRLKLETCMKDPKRLGNFKVNSNNFTIRDYFFPEFFETPSYQFTIPIPISKQSSEKNGLVYPSEPIYNVNCPFQH